MQLAVRLVLLLTIYRLVLECILCFSSVSHMFVQANICIHKCNSLYADCTRLLNSLFFGAHVVYTIAVIIATGCRFSDVLHTTASFGHAGCSHAIIYLQNMLCHNVAVVCCVNYSSVLRTLY